MTDDLISRADAIARLEAVAQAANEANLPDRRDGLRDALDAICAMPAYEVGVRELEWTPNSDYRPYGLIAGDHSGFWTVHRSDDAETFEWADPYGKTTRGFATTDIAIASLEKERAARIRSALTATPAADVAEADILAAAGDEYVLEHPMETDWHRMGRTSTVRGMMVRLGLYPKLEEAIDAALARMKEAKA